MTEINITMDENGRLSVKVSQGTPMFLAIGILETVKNILMTSDPTKSEEKVEE